MKNIIIPVDFTATTQSTLRYIADFSHDYLVEEIILLRVHHVPLVAQLFPSPDMQQLTTADLEEANQADEFKFKILVEKFKLQVNTNTKIESIFSTEKLLPFLSYQIEYRQPELIVLGHSKLNDESDNLLNESIVQIAKMSVAPVLLIPLDTKYKKVNQVLLPTSFENLDKLKSFKSLCKSQTWLHARLLILNVDNQHQHDEAVAFDMETFERYLEGYNYMVNYTYGKNIAQEILTFADEYRVQLILALPGKHNFMYHLMHESVTKNFALESPFPVLLLK